jgi:formylglycine-generating enzyme required for sulfatase activity/uncharacterized caspase-like protein
MVRALVTICFAVLALAAQSAFAEKRVALVIGNGAYQHAPKLENPKRDAAAIAESLRRLGFSEVRMQTDLTQAQMLSELRSFGDSALNADWAVVFYAGHGIQVDGQNYLIPTDAKLARASDVEDETVALERVLARAREAKRLRLVILDACRDNPFANRMEQVGRKRALGRGLAAIEPGSGELIAYAARDGHQAEDGNAGHSPFTAALLAHIEEPGLEVNLMFRKVRGSVLTATARTQEPFVYGSLPEEAFYFKVPASAPAPVAPQTPPQAPLAADAQAWIAVQTATSEAILEEFIRRYPYSIYVPFAKARVEELRRTKEAMNVPKPGRVYQKPDGAACDGLLVVVAMGPNPCINPGSGESFKDCPDCPEMVIVPQGSFLIGSPESEPERSNREGPQHLVTIPKPFAAGQFTIRVKEYLACVSSGGCKPPEWQETGSQYNVKTGTSDHYKKLGNALTGDDYPIVGVSWDDAKAYAAWLSGKTGANYRLLSEAEREYAGRAGTATPFWWGSSVTPQQANYNGNNTYAGGGKGEYRQKTLSVNSFKPNPWGLYQVHGNVYDWAEDCWHDTYSGAPADGSPWTSAECRSRVLRNGSWDERS